MYKRHNPSLWLHCKPGCTHHTLTICTRYTYTSGHCLIRLQHDKAILQGCLGETPWHYYHRLYNFNMNSIPQEKNGFATHIGHTPIEDGLAFRAWFQAASTSTAITCDFWWEGCGENACGSMLAGRTCPARCCNFGSGFRCSLGCHLHYSCACSGGGLMGMHLQSLKSPSCSDRIRQLQDHWLHL